MAGPDQGMLQAADLAPLYWHRAPAVCRDAFSRRQPFGCVFERTIHRGVRCVCALSLLFHFQHAAEEDRSGCAVVDPGDAHFDEAGLRERGESCPAGRFRGPLRLLVVERVRRWAVWGPHDGASLHQWPCARHTG